MEKIALLPGGFKPPHAGHYNMAKWLVANTDADTILVRVGSKERDGITRKMSLALWNLYTQDDNNIIVKASTSNSPVRDVYDYIEQEAPEGSTVYLGLGSKDETDQRFANIGKFAEPRNIKFKTILVPPQAGGVSGTEMRGFIKNNNKELFQKFLPDHIDKEEAWGIVTGLKEDFYDPNDHHNDFAKSSEYKAGYSKEDNIEPGYKYRRGGMYSGGGMGFGGMYETRGGEQELHIYDFDETIARVETVIPYTVKSPEGKIIEKGETTSVNFEKKQNELENDYDKGIIIDFDFGAFEKQIENAIINEPVYNKLLNSLQSSNVKTTVLTARSIGHPVTRYLKSIGLEVYVVPLGLQIDGKVTGQDKANWIDKRIKKTTKKVYFIDDSENNRIAVNLLKDKHPNINFKIENPPKIKEKEVDEMMMGMMTEPEKRKHAKNLKRLNKDLRKQGDQYMEVPKYLKGTLTRKMYEGDTYEKMAAKGKKKGNLKQGTVRKRLKIKDGEKIPLSKINKAISRLKKMKDRSEKNQKYLKALNLAKTLKTTTHKENINEADPKKGTGKKPKGSGRRLYTDENPKDTVSVKFSTRQDIVDTLTKKSFKSKSHKRQSQVINLIHQRVRAALGRTKDPQKKKSLKSAFEYIKKRKEASKKKTQRMKKENAFTKEWWKEIINEIITEGGAAGHMAHPFNLSNVNNGRDLLNIFEKSADSLQNNPGAVKIDGVNSSIRLVNLDGKRQFVMDRGSKKELDIKGITKDDLLRRFGDGHGMIKVGGEVLDLFNAALPNLENDLKKLGAWDNPNILFNMEYVSGKTNVQEYGSNFIAIHGLNKIESKEVQGARKMLTKRISSEISYDKNALQSLLNALEPIAKKRGYEVYGSVPTKMKKKPNFTSALSKTYTVNAGESSETKTLGQWLNSLNNIPEEDFIFMNVGYEKDSSTVNRKKVGAVSKQVYLAILNGENIDGLFEDEKDRKKAIEGFVTYLATEKLGDEVLKVLDSPMGSVENHEGVVIRDNNIASVPFKITGKFILGGLATSFR